MKQKHYQYLPAVWSPSGHLPSSKEILTVRGLVSLSPSNASPLRSKPGFSTHDILDEQVSLPSVKGMQIINDNGLLIQGFRISPVVINVLPSMGPCPPSSRKPPCQDFGLIFSLLPHASLEFRERALQISNFVTSVSCEHRSISTFLVPHPWYSAQAKPRFLDSSLHQESAHAPQGQLQFLSFSLNISFLSAVLLLFVSNVSEALWCLQNIRSQQTFLSRPDSKYFWLHRPCGLCHNCLVMLLQHKTIPKKWAWLICPASYSLPTLQIYNHCNLFNIPSSSMR